jgi:hypothetical protein
MKQSAASFCLTPAQRHSFEFLEYCLDEAKAGGYAMFKPPTKSSIQLETFIPNDVQYYFMTEYRELEFEFNKNSTRVDIMFRG